MSTPSAANDGVRDSRLLDRKSFVDDSFKRIVEELSHSLRVTRIELVVWYTSGALAVVTGLSLAVWFVAGIATSGNSATVLYALAKFLGILVTGVLLERAIGAAGRANAQINTLNQNMMVTETRRQAAWAAALDDDMAGLRKILDANLSQPLVPMLPDGSPVEFGRTRIARERSGLSFASLVSSIIAWLPGGRPASPSVERSPGTTQPSGTSPLPQDRQANGENGRRAANS
jgi:hypothetical protein